MTQPIQRIGALTALITLTRLGARRLRQQPLHSARVAAKTTLSFLSGPMIFAACLISFLYVLMYGLSFLGAASERLLGAEPEHYYLVQTSSIATPVWTRWGASSSSLRAPRDLAQDSIESKASFFALNKQQRLDALESAQALLDNESKNTQAAEDAAFRREGLALLRALKSGKTLEAALAQLSSEPAIVAPSPRVLELLAIQKALAEARAVRSDTVPLVEHLIPRFFTTPEARPLGWAQRQAGNNFGLALQGLLALFGIVLVLAFGVSAVIGIQQALTARQEALRQEWDRQSVEKAAGSARSPSKPPRL